MIIIEGTDLLGKTTLANALVRKLNRAGLPHVYSHFSKLADSWHIYHHYIPFIQRNVVMDRFYMSRCAYGQALKNQAVIDLDTYRMLDAKVRLVGGLHVLLTASDDYIRHNWDRYSSRGEMYNLDAVQSVNDTFMRFADESVYDVDIHAHLTQPGVYIADDFIDMVLSEYSQRQHVLNSHLKSQFNNKESL